MKVDKVLIKEDIVTTVMKENVRIVLSMDDARTLRELLGKQSVLCGLYFKLDNIV